ncbi:aromatic motif membrane protein [Mycoplasma elephantis]|uniref:aromatic motif membrane protein n=1 Tax=Mycoplasma elephantis TaxID=114882 RepID=UPI00048884B8|nr:aromatic motif membrane protein [Mycoplasma elephantis]
MKKYKIFTLISSFFAFGFLNLSVSCQTYNINFKHSHNNFDDFCKNKQINKLLNFIYDNDSDKINTYIKSQKTLNSSNYINKVKENLYFNSNLINSYQYDGHQIDIFKEKVPYPMQNPESYDNLISENWLWYLYNLPNFKFVYAPLFQNEASDEIFKKTQWLSRKIGRKCIPTTNNIIDITCSQIEKNNDDWWSIDLLTSDGYIINIEKFIDNDEKKIRLKSYLYTFKNLLLEEENIKNFNLTKYAQTFTDFENIDNLTTKQALFSEKYGSDRLQFSLYSVIAK